MGIIGKLAAAGVLVAFLGFAGVVVALLKVANLMESAEQEVGNW